ncbi:MAG: transketolase C-terminal domain-containing protein [Actinomycetota bacterium]|nr:transketolase C-terminal domain-containing protein [Actinomycetota bacterium]
MTETVRYIDAISSVLRHELDSDEDVLILGEDVSYGGPFGATAGLSDAFGPKRVIDTPISEGAVMGLAVGAALSGRRPVVEIMFADFVTLAMDQLVNHAAKLRYMTDGLLSVPLTVRVQGGVGGGYGAHHSQSLESWFLHVPGLKVVAPATVADAGGLLTAAIRDDDPVIVLEHRGLYWTKGPFAPDGPPTPIGTAAVVRSGSDATVVAVSRMVQTALTASEKLAAEGIDIELIDLRSVAPIDWETIEDSVRRTRRLVVVHEAVVTGGLGAELVAGLSASAFGALVSPALRVGAPHAPVPASPFLEQFYPPSVDDVVGAVHTALEDWEGRSIHAS